MKAHLAVGDYHLLLFPKWSRYREQCCDSSLVWSMEWSLSKETNAMLEQKSSEKKTRGCQKLTNTTVVLATLAGLTVFAGLLASLVVPKAFRGALQQELLLVEGTAAFEEWSAPQSDQRTSFYFFSVLNPEQVMRGQKPNLKEMGPYTFRMREEKSDIQFFPQNASVTYRERKFWYFLQNESNGELKDVVTTFNVPSYGGAAMAKGDWMQMALNSVLEGQTPFVEHTVSELLFDGYEDILLSLADMMGHDLGYPADRFGWFYRRNGTTWGDGQFNMLTGEDDINDLGKIHTWNGLDRTHFEGECGEIRGSAGGFFPPGDERMPLRESVEIFSHDACRTFTFHKKSNNEDVKEYEVERIPVVSYELDGSTFANGTVNPKNTCFANNLPTGVQNNTRCKLETNSFLSFPHFLTADNFFQQQFTENSIRPDSAKHTSRILIEPALGIPLEFLLRLQINMRLDPIPGITIFEDLPRELYLPVFWFDVEARVRPEMASRLHLLLQTPSLINLGGKGLLAVSVLIAAVIITRHLVTNRNNNNNNERVNKL